LSRPAVGVFVETSARATGLRPRLGTRSAGTGLLGAVAAVVLGIAMLGLALVRDRPDELLAGVFVIVVALGLVAWVMNARSGSRTLPTIAATGWAVQVSASMIYHYSEVALDAGFFHGNAARIAATGEPIVFPARNWGNEGVFLLLSSVYRVTGPSILLGFVVFAAVALVGKVLFAHAMLTLLPLLGRPAESIAIGVVLLPSFVWWTAAISKEAIVILGMGVVFASLFRTGGAAPNLIGIAAGLGIITIVRAHVTLLVAAAVYVYLFFAFQLPQRRGGRRAWLIVLGSMVVVGGLLFGVRYLGAEGFGGLEDVRLDASSRSEPGGSTIPSRPIRTPIDVPIGVFTMMFRPTLLEFFSLITFLQAVETTASAGLLLWLLSQGRRRLQSPRFGADAIQLRAIRRFGWFYTASFIYSFSGVSYNLGLISRQRAQLWMPLLLVLAASLVSARKGGPPRSGPPKPRERPRPAGRPVRPGPARIRHRPR